MKTPQPDANESTASTDNSPSATAKRYRSIWISDIHLGQRDCQAETLLDFIKHHDAEHWYLVGDIIDSRALKQTQHWPQLHNDIVQKMLRKVRKGARVVCIPGNHDRFLLGFARHSFGVILVLPETMHETADHRRLWVVHGDQFDSVIQYAPWLQILGRKNSERMIPVGRALNRVRRRLGFQEWSLSTHLHTHQKNSGICCENYEQALLRASRKKGTDGVICGHTHRAGLKEVSGQLYGNTGDWVDSCTALVEHFDGRLELIHWKNPTADTPVSPIIPDTPQAATA